MNECFLIHPYNLLLLVDPSIHLPKISPPRFQSSNLLTFLLRSSSSIPISMAPFRLIPTILLLHFMISAALFIALFFLPADSKSIPIYGIQVVKEFPHDPAAFTQGLLYTENDTIYESTGLYGQSSVRRVALETGRVEDIHRMEDTYFGEGLTLVCRRLYQVTWKTSIGFIYEKNTLQKIKTFPNHMSDGWGLATDGKIIFGSDGSSTLYHIDPHTYAVTQKYVVKYNGKEVNNLNELEYVHGEVWANVWQTDCIARISGKDGSMLGWIYLPSLREDLLKAGYKGIDVLNGIAWDATQDRIFVTGKLWPKLFQINVQPVRKSLHVDIEKLCILPPLS